MFRPDGSLVASLTDGAGAFIFDIGVDTALEAICSMASRGLTPDEWEAYLPSDTPYAPSCT